MPNPRGILELILLGRSDSNIDFNDVRRLLDALGFVERIKGSHHIFARTGIAEIINIQPKGNKAKPYQVKQIRNIILNYKLGIDDE
jgi:predicted RNA binding protein YcfA (HicA-like mRNA interferase family)